MMLNKRHSKNWLLFGKALQHIIWFLYTNQARTTHDYTERLMKVTWYNKSSQPEQASNWHSNHPGRLNTDQNAGQTKLHKVSISIMLSLSLAEVHIQQYLNSTAFNGRRLYRIPSDYVVSPRDSPKLTMCTNNCEYKLSNDASDFNSGQAGKRSAIMLSHQGNLLRMVRRHKKYTCKHKAEKIALQQQVTTVSPAHCSKRRPLSWQRNSSPRNLVTLCFSRSSCTHAPARSHIWTTYMGNHAMPIKIEPRLVYTADEWE